MLITDNPGYYTEPILPPEHAWFVTIVFPSYKNLPSID